MARGKPARKALPPARARRRRRRDGRDAPRARRRDLRVPRRQLLRARSQEERGALRRHRRCAGGARHRPLRHRGQGAPDRRRPRGVSHLERAAALHPRLRRRGERRRPGAEDARPLVAVAAEPSRDRADARARSLHLLQHAAVRSRHHGREHRAQHRVLPRRARVSVQLRTRRAVRGDAAPRADAIRAALLGRLHAMGLRARVRRSGADLRAHHALLSRAQLRRRGAREPDHGDAVRRRGRAALPSGAVARRLDGDRMRALAAAGARRRRRAGGGGGARQGRAQR